MGCVNLTEKKENDGKVQNKEFQIANGQKIKCVEDKNQKKIQNENMRTHDSLRQDHSSEIQGYLSSSPKNEDKVKNSKKERGNKRTCKDGELKGLKVKLESRLLKGRQKYDQATEKEGKDGECLSQGLIIEEESTSGKKREKNEEQEWRGRDDNISKQRNIKEGDNNKQEINSARQLFPREQNKENEEYADNDKVKSSLGIENKKMREQKSINNNFHQKRIKRVGYRSPRGRSCNLFKTFEDDYIEQQPQLQIRKQESQSMGNISN